MMGNQVLRVQPADLALVLCPCLGQLRHMLPVQGLLILRISDTHDAVFIRLTLIYSMESNILIKLPDELKKRIAEYAELLNLKPGEVILYMIRYALASDDGLFDDL